MSVRNAPCRGCPYREVGCHARCEVYREWAARRKQAFVKIKAELEVRDYEIRNAFFRQEGPRKR